MGVATVALTSLATTDTRTPVGTQWKGGLVYVLIHTDYTELNDLVETCAIDCWKSKGKSVFWVVLVDPSEDTLKRGLGI